MKILVQSAPFDVGDETNAFTNTHSNVGAVVTFTGIVRDDDCGSLDAMEIEHYPAMTQKAITQHAQSAQNRWNLADVLVIHRYGKLVPGDVIMMVATAARHRADAFQAAEFLMDYLKSRAPFWKKEWVKGSPRWAEAKQLDEDALARWE